MRLEQALREYEKKVEKLKKERAKIKEKYNKKLNKDKKEILKKIDNLEQKEIPLDVDDRIKKIVSAEKRMYASTLKRMLEKVETIEDFGKLLPELSKLHVSHGKYLLILFEKDIYAINKILKRMSEEYQEYLEKINKTQMPVIKLEDMDKEREEISKEIELLTEEKKEIEIDIKRRKDELERFYKEADLEGLEKEINRIGREVKKKELELRSKISKLQKPIKRMRTGEEIANRVIENSYYGIEHPDEFLSFLMRIYPRLEGKYKKTAEWLLDNLKEKAEEIIEKRKQLSKRREEREEIISDGKELEEEIEMLKRKLQEKEEQIIKLRERLEKLEAEYEESIKKLEEILGTKIERR